MNDFFPAVSVWVRFSSCSICTLHSDASYVPHPISHAYEWAHSESFVWHEKTLLAETVWHLEHYAHFLGDPQRRCDRGNYRYNCVRVCVNHIGHHAVRCALGPPWIVIVIKRRVVCGSIVIAGVIGYNRFVYTIYQCAGLRLFISPDTLDCRSVRPVCGNRYCFAIFVCAITIPSDIITI